MDWKIVVAAPLVAWLVVANAAALKMPRNWGSDSHAPTSGSYLHGLDPEVKFNDQPALVVRTTEHVSDIDYGAVTKYVDAWGYQGKRVRFSGMLKTADASTWAGAFMGVSAGTAARDWSLSSMESLPYGSTPTTGTSDWHPVSVVLEVPDQADVRLFLGIALVGNGQAWLSDMKFEEVGDNVPVTRTRIGIDAAKMASAMQLERIKVESDHVKKLPDNLDLRL
jgi:hypothetical protein